MIRAGIMGGQSDAAGQLIRILVNHPDVEIVRVVDPDLEGIEVAKVHKGLIGDTYLRFEAQEKIDDLNMIFLCYPLEGDGAAFMSRHDLPDSMRVIDFSGDHVTEAFQSHFDPDASPTPGKWVYGLPELFRKPLVRGATRATVPGPVAMAVATALLPLAKNHLIEPDAEIHIAASIASNEAEPGEVLALLDHESLDEVALALKALQPEFSGKLSMVLTSGGWQRGVAATVYLPSTVSEAKVEEVYQDFFDDHNFTFLTKSIPNLSEVDHTNKCLLRLDHVNSYLVVSVVIDDLMKGSAGNAVHLMNLLFGLQERVGLC
ncbi:MAG: N-acetyl-gamma-glutamyl-phosphate reductase [Paramuribaculum sp.]|nr:N-acetyl-gamma-glutamyl-phosphate reductase [Paramuribaculum sp.]